MSDEKEMKDQTEGKKENSINGEGQVENQSTETKELSPEEKYADLHDKYIRIHAEFDNYRRRTNKEKLDIIATANGGVLKEMLPVLDDFERAIANNEKMDDIKSLKEGFVLIYHKFKHILESKGLTEMKVEGEVFDSELHEAIANVPAPKKKDAGKVIEAVEKGYLLNDKVVRYAKVVVGQ